MNRNLGQLITEEHSGTRLDNYLAKYYKFLSRSAWQKKVIEGFVQINSKTISKSSYNLQLGDKISYYYPQSVEPIVNSSIRVIWQDRDLACVYKPAPLPMHENGPYNKNTFKHILKQELGEDWSAVHRLDLETSGIVICAKSTKMRDIIADKFRKQKIKKTYLAIVNRVPMHNHWEVDAPIGDLENSTIRIKKWVNRENGKQATTQFECINQGKRFALIQAKPLTGRTNQIRIHLAYSGHIIVGDKLFHPDESIFNEYFINGLTKRVISQTGNKRLCLHAAKIRFKNPYNMSYIEVESELPDELNQVWNRLHNDKGLF